MLASARTHLREAGAGSPAAYGGPSLPFSGEGYVDRATDLADLAHSCLILELETFPKPGLVSHVDAGSHADMDAAMFRASAAAIRPFLRDLAAAGADLRGMDPLRRIGLEAEAAMLAATGGVNTHRGAIFGLGLLCAAAGARDAGVDLPLGVIVARLWGEAILATPAPEPTHGGTARRRYGAGGARSEAASGFRTLYDVGLPVLRRMQIAVPDDAEAARVETCFALIAALEDTNLLHRAGPDGLRTARREAGRFLSEGGIARRDGRERAMAVHQAFVARRLSPGGSADMLAMTLFVHEQDVRAGTSGRSADLRAHETRDPVACSINRPRARASA